MAVSTVDNGIKVLANADGVRLLRTLENRSFDASRSASETVTKVVSCNPSKSLNEDPLEGKSGASSRGNSSSNSVYLSCCS